MIKVYLQPEGSEDEYYFLGKFNAEDLLRLPELLEEWSVWLTTRETFYIYDTACFECKNEEAYFVLLIDKRDPE